MLCVLVERDVGFAPTKPLASHNTLFYAYDSHSESRFNADAVEAHYNVTSLLGGPGDGFCFDTNSVLIRFITSFRSYIGSTR